MCWLLGRWIVGSIYPWMAGWIVGWLVCKSVGMEVGWLGRHIVGWKDHWMDWWIIGWIDRWMDRLLDGWIAGWIDGLLDDMPIVRHEKDSEFIFAFCKNISYRCPWMMSLCPCQIKILTRQKDHTPYQAQKAAAAAADDNGHKDHAQQWVSWLGWEGADSKLKNGYCCVCSYTLSSKYEPLGGWLLHCLL